MGLMLISQIVQHRRIEMRSILFGLATTAALAIATPASAQHWHHGWHHAWRHGPHFGFSFRLGGPYAYAPCRIIRTKRVRPNGTVIIRRVRRCY